MLSDQEIDATHPDAFDFVFGNLPEAKRADFDRHLFECRYCQTAVNEYGEIGLIIKQLPPHVDPAAELEDRVIGAVVADSERRERLLAGEDQDVTQVYPELQPQPGAEPETKLLPRLEPSSSPEAGPQARPLVTRLPVWRRPRQRLVAIAAVAAAVIIAAIAVIPNLGGGRQLNLAQVTVVIHLHATTAAEVMGDRAAAGRATARQAGPSWTFAMTVHGLKVLPGNDVYECWWLGPGNTKAHPQLVSGGTFIVDKSGSTTVTMTTGIDPRQFTTMEVTAEPPGTGALSGAVLLSGQAL